MSCNNKSTRCTASFQINETPDSSLARGNVQLEVKNFNDLSSFQAGHFDLVLAVETLCHSENFDVTLDSIGRVMGEGGILVVYDGFRSENLDPSPDIEKAIEYTEKAMAVSRFSSVKGFENSASIAGFTCISSENRSKEIMPNLIRLSDIAKSYFKIGPISKFLLYVLPRGLVSNSVAGLLMARTVESGAHKYFKIVFRKDN